MVSAEEIDDRKASVLRAIVSHYVRSGEPVGSNTIVSRFRLGVSPATVRNDMGILEEAGYIFQPHTSAGRIPTDRGYRFFVDSAAPDVRLPVRESLRIEEFFDEPRWELEESLRRTAALLSTLTDHAAIVFAPSLDKSIIRHVELARLAGNKAMVLLVTDTGRVENHVVVLPESLDDVLLDHTVDMLNRVVADVPLETAGSTLIDALERFPLELRAAVSTVAESLKEELDPHDSGRVFLEGTSNIVDQQKFADLDMVKQVIGALEHRRLLLEVLADAVADGVMVRIGSENTIEEMQLCSVVTAPYAAAGAPIGSIAVVGPTRMDYRHTMAAVQEVSSALGRMLADLGM